MLLLETDAAGAAGVGSALGLLATALLLGIRHGIDWDHLAAISDITSTTATADAAEEAHARADDRAGSSHIHGHGGPVELQTHAAHPAAGRGEEDVTLSAPSLDRRRIVAEQRRAIYLGTLYAVGHAVVVALLGLAALAFGALLPDWVDPIMGRVVGVTLLLLGTWVFYSLYGYARHGRPFRLRSRWLLIFDGVRYGWRRLQAWLHGHEHADPIEMSSYGARTAFGVGMIHGIGAETGSQVLIIAAIGGAAAHGLGVPMMIAFIAGLLVSNTLIVLVTGTGFVASRLRQRLYVAAGVLAGTFSIVVGLVFLAQAEDVLPDLGRILPI